MRSVPVLIGCVTLFTASCSDEATGPTSADRAKFVGTWAGSFACPGGGPASDTLVINLGASPLGFSINIHVGFANPDTVSGDLAEPNRINVPQQTMGGAPGTAQITYGTLMTYSQSGFGITCGGADYTKVP